MAVYDYEIGTTLTGESADMVNVEELFDDGEDNIDHTKACPAPKGMAVMPYGKYRQTISGLEYGDGWPSVIWVYDVMTQEHWDALVNEYLTSGAQSARVYIRTRIDDEGSYSYYYCVMHRPKIGEEATYENRAWRNVRIRFTHMELEEDPV